MKKTLILVFFLNFSCSPDFSEISFSDITFIENSLKVIRIIGGTKEDVVKKVLATDDGGFVIVGHTKSTDGDFENKNREGNDIFLTKLDSKGQIIWTNTYGGSDDDIGNDVIESSDGSFYIIGYSKSNDGDASINKGQHDNWLLKTDSFGKLLWEKSYGFAGHDHAYNIIKTRDGGLFFNGFLDVTASEGQGSTSRHGVGEFWCHKVNMNGDVVWRRYFGGSNNDRSYDSVETQDGGFILVGTSESQDIEISNSFGSYDIWVVRLSSSGELIWEKSFGGSAIDEGIIIINNQDNSYTILGNTNSPKIDGFKTQGMNDFLLIKLDSSGGILSKVRHGSPQFDYAKDLKQTIDGSYFVTGYSRNPLNSQGVNFENNAVFLSQIQPNGIIQNTWKLNGSNEDLGSSISQLQNGSIIMVGTTESNDGDFNIKKLTGNDIFIAILNK
jgi:hypothetical protein